MNDQKFDLEQKDVFGGHGLRRCSEIVFLFRNKSADGQRHAV